MICKIKAFVKRHYLLHSVLYFIFFKQAKVDFILKYTWHFPVFHSRFLIKHSCSNGLGSTYSRDFPCNIKAPRYFNEKLLWLKYYFFNKCDLCAACYDKFLVREYVKHCGCGYILNELYGVWDKVSDIPWDSLPEEYVIKKTNGCQGHVFKRKDSPFDKEAAIKLLSNRASSKRQVFLSSGDIFATKMPQRYICEKLLVSELGYSSPEDFKFYCFNGEPQFLLYIFDRNGIVYREAFKHVDLSDASEYFDTAENFEITKPSCYDEMLEICRKLSAPFPFVRVDLYVQNGHPVFGELTFTPAGALVLYHVFDKNGKINYPALEEMGRLLKLPL